jgi:hypothetical protein
VVEVLQSPQRVDRDEDWVPPSGSPQRIRRGERAQQCDFLPKLCCKNRRNVSSCSQPQTMMPCPTFVHDRFSAVVGPRVHAEQSTCLAVYLWPTRNAVEPTSCDVSQQWHRARVASILRSAVR